MSNMVIIGAGECGTRAAFALREEGYQGEITLIGDESGLPYERPPLSKPDGVHICRKSICDQADLDSAKITYIPGKTVVRIEPERKRILVDSDFIEYTKLLIATGASPRRLTCAGSENALYFRTFNDAEVLFSNQNSLRRIAIVGAGLIGMELAAYLLMQGKEVTVIEMTSTPLGRAVPGPLAKKLTTRHIDEGLELLLETGIERIDDGKVVFNSGEFIEVDAVIAAIGVTPNIELALNAKLGVENGIRVDASLRTSDPNIFAAGDCAQFPCPYSNKPVRMESWRNARNQGNTAAKSMLGNDEAFGSIPWFWSDQFNLGLQVVGLWDSKKSAVRRVKGDYELLFQVDESGRLTCAAGLGIGNSVAKEIRIAEKLMERQIAPVHDQLADPSYDLKKFLRA